jgi:hypothetical protein
MAAVTSLSQKNLRKISPDIEAELVKLRLAAGELCCEAATAKTKCPPQAIDLFTDAEGLPEIALARLDGHTLAAGILHHGALIVRGLYKPSHLNRLYALAATEEEENLRSEAPLGCSAHTLFEMLEVYRDCGLLQAVKQYLDEEPVMFAERTKLRHHRAGRDNYAIIPWHQDVNFFGQKSYAINCWAAVTSCGEDNPGLGFIPRRTEYRHGWKEENGIAPLDYGKAIPVETLGELTDKHPAVHPILQPGDAVLFDEMTVHKTAVRSWKKREQIVTISWFFRASAFPDWGTPLAI